MTVISYFFQFLVAHAVADFVLQSETMGSGKNRYNLIHKEKGINFPAWYYWLSAHALVHGGAVYIITGNVVLGMLETLLHGLIDYSKCEGKLNFHQDQALHIICKIGYCFFV